MTHEDLDSRASRYVFPPARPPELAIRGSSKRFPVHRIYCAGRNYAARAREMGPGAERQPPFFFQKPADALVPNGAPVAYPPRTQDFHHEIELVVALGRGGRDIPAAAALDCVFGYAVGNDLTRRDLMFAAQEQRQPWEVSKAFDDSAPITAIHPVERVGYLNHGRIWLGVNGSVRQDADISQLVWNVPALIAELSTLFRLSAGDLIFTGTPAGVGAVMPGDELRGGVEGLEELITRIEWPQGAAAYRKAI
jgi:fumarylpyruvate hydrolase